MPLAVTRPSPLRLVRRPNAVRAFLALNRLPLMWPKNQHYRVRSPELSPCGSLFKYAVHMCHLPGGWSVRLGFGRWSRFPFVKSQARRWRRSQHDIIVFRLRRSGWCQTLRVARKSRSGASLRVLYENGMDRRPKQLVKRSSPPNRRASAHFHMIFVVAVAGTSYLHKAAFESSKKNYTHG